jgi:LmbE family N-acetylglucosaminyl deacetylase
MVAHPDDEILFAYPALMARDCHVVCMTSGSNQERKAEFTSVMNLVNTSRNQKGLQPLGFDMLDFPEEQPWARQATASRVVEVVQASDFTSSMDKHSCAVVSHGRQGEYGHRDHKLTHIIAKEVCKLLKVKRFVWFRRVYDMMPDEFSPACALRNALLDLYKSQSGSVALCRNYYSEYPSRKF